MKINHILYILNIFLIISIISLIAFELTERQSMSGTPIYRFGPEDSCLVQVHDNPSFYHFITVQTGSMSPAIRINDTVISVDAERFGIENVTVGDIIVFKRGDNLICHRVVSVHDDGFYTKGDANVSQDQYVYFNEVQAVVIAIFWGN